MTRPKDEPNHDRLGDAELEKVAGGWPNFGRYVAPTVHDRLKKLDKKPEEKKEDTPK